MPKFYHPSCLYFRFKVQKPRCFGRILFQIICSSADIICNYECKNRNFLPDRIVKLFLCVADPRSRVDRTIFISYNKHIVIGTVNRLLDYFPLLFIGGTEHFHAGRELIHSKNRFNCLLMLKKRNTAAHIYNEEEIDEMLLLIRDSFIPAFTALEKTLKSKLDAVELG